MMDRVRSRIVTGPREGWLTLVLVALLAVSVAWSLDDAALVLGQGTWTDFLAWAALGGVLMGFLGARAGWNRPMAHTIAAVAAGLVVPLMVGSVLLPHASWSAAFHATADSVTDAVIDFAVLGLPVTRQSGHYLLVLGLLCWANGQFAASAVFRSGRSSSSARSWSRTCRPPSTTRSGSSSCSRWRRSSSSSASTPSRSGRRGSGAGSATRRSSARSISAVGPCSSGSRCSSPSS